MMEQIIKHKSRLFYISYFLYVVATVMQSTMFTEYSLISKCFVWMRYLAFVLGALKIIIDLLHQWNKDKKNKLEKKIVAILSLKSIQQIGLYTLIAVILLLVSLKTDDRSLMFVFVIILAAKDIELDTIMKRTLIVQIILMAGILISSRIGIIPDLLFKRDMNPIRHALGYTYPSVMVTFFFFILLLYIWVKNEPIDWKEFLVIETINFLVFELTDSKTGFILIAFIAFIIWIIGMNKLKLCMIQLNNDKNFWNRAYKIIYDFLPIWLSVILFILCITLPWEGTQLVNRFLSNRIQLIVNAVKNYGIPILGNHIEWIGFGGVTDTDSLLASYNFVDSSYGFILINYGWIVFLLTIISMVWCCRKIRKNESGIRQFLFFMVLIYCFIEPRLLELQVNPFLIIVSPLLIDGFDIRNIKKRSFKFYHK